MIARSVRIVSKGIIIVGYGTRKGNLEEVLQIQARRLRCRGWENVGIAYFRVSTPTIPDAIDEMARKGVDEIVMIPYYIAEGTLTKELIPEKVGIECEDGEIDVDGKNVIIHIAPAFGLSYSLTNIILDRIADAGGDRDCGILVLGHGTRYRALSNRNVVKTNMERLQGLGYSHALYSFNEFCEPSIKDTLDALEKQGVKKIIAIPLFIAMGLHLGEEIPEQLGIPAYSGGGEITVNGRKIQLCYTRPVEDDPRLVDNMDSKVRHYLGE
ncbi:cobalamin biosynthesis protein CbiX [methanogenic archaeon mixed culture ISO4-G1]|nr:cobalamin biosynthesis protein CbiX [methanogenic archaeon mixed culture ISO4-G1]